MNDKLKPIALGVGAAFAASVASLALANAEADLFAAEELTASQVLLADNHDGDGDGDGDDGDGDGSCGEDGSCGGDDKGTAPTTSLPKPMTTAMATMATRTTTRRTATTKTAAPRPQPMAP